MIEPIDANIRPTASLDEDPPFLVLDEDAIASGQLQRDPYDYAFVEQSLPISMRDEVLTDAPEIPWRGSYAMRQLDYGPRFDDISGVHRRGRGLPSRVAGRGGRYCGGAQRGPGATRVLKRDYF